MNEWFKDKYIKLTIISVIAIISFVAFSFLWGTKQEKEEENFANDSSLAMIQGNSLLFSSPLPQMEIEVVRKVKVVTTAYSSTVWQTDDTPFITAAGTYVRDGIVANNLLAFGTKIRIPEIYGEKVFVVEDRMNWKKGFYHVDIWFPSYQEAKDFGAKTTYIEVIKEI